MSISAMKQALEALEWNYGTDLENIENCTAWLDKLNATIPALRQAIAEAEDAVAAEREACVKLVEEMLEPWLLKEYIEKTVQAIRARGDAIEFEEMVEKGTKAWDGTPDNWVDDLRGGAEKQEFECPRCGHCCREWVGLTDGERVDLLKEYEGRLWVDVCRVIEAKLKEKNQ